MGTPLQKNYLKCYPISGKIKEVRVMEKPNYYEILPADVRYDKNLKLAEKILYSELTALAYMKGYCYASNSYFANLYEVHKKTVGGG